ncbi:MAG: hypothetical protein K2Y13_05865 [Burkholderiaceae bacterium]|nr:hypothetical protein [Burkholderiaceae bacterium]
MNVSLHEFTIGIKSAYVTTESPCFRPPSWPPPRDWPVVIDRNGAVVSRWGDPIWDFSPWARGHASINFADGKNYERKRYAEPLDAANADLLRLIVTWLIWGPRKFGSVRSVVQYFSVIRGVAALCCRNKIIAADLMRFPAVFEQVPTVIAKSIYPTAITWFHQLYDAREALGFTIFDHAGLTRLAAVAPQHEVVQTPYIPPRIWLYQVQRLHECLSDFVLHQEKVEQCFRFCLDSYTKHYGSLEVALTSSGAKPGPFGYNARKKKTYAGSFSDAAVRFGIGDLLMKWIGAGEGGRLDVDYLSAYFSCVTHAGMAYIANFTLQRRNEVASIRTSCLKWEEDEKLGRVPIICGETTKTDLDSHARWVASPSVEVAVRALSSIAHMRMMCDRMNPMIRPTTADQIDPYLYSSGTEPWGNGLQWSRPYHIRTNLMCFSVLMKYYHRLLDHDQMRITAEDLKMARRLTPNLSEEKGFAVGEVWPLAWHQYRRTGAVNMFASGEISDSTMQQQMKHSTRLMSLYYGRNSTRRHLNNEVQKAVILAMYQAQAERLKIVATSDRFVSPHAPERKQTLVMNVLSAKDLKDLIAMAEKGAVPFRENRLGGCMRDGVCEYGGIESVARCGGGDGGKPCMDVLYDRNKELKVRADLRRLNEELKLLRSGQPRYNQKIMERRAMENYLDAISTC